MAGKFGGVILSEFAFNIYDILSRPIKCLMWGAAAAAANDCKVCLFARFYFAETKVV